MNIDIKEFWAAENERFYLHIRDIVNSTITMQRLNSINNKWEIGLKDTTDRITIYNKEKTIFGESRRMAIKIELELIRLKGNSARIEMYYSAIDKDVLVEFIQLKNYKWYESRIENSYVIHLYSREEIAEFIRSLIVII